MRTAGTTYRTTGPLWGAGKLVDKRSTLDPDVPTLQAARFQGRRVTMARRS